MVANADYKTLMEKGDHAVSVGNLPKALECYTQAVACFETMDSLRSLANIATMLSKHAEALSALDRAKKMAPYSALIEADYGMVFLHMNQKETAQRHFFTALEYVEEGEPLANSDQLWVFIGAIYMDHWEILKAVQSFKTALTLNPKNVGAVQGLQSCSMKVN